MRKKLGTAIATDGTPVELVVVSGPAHEYTQEELEAAWAKVRPEPYWKDPVNATIHASDRDVVAAAIWHFTATEPVFTVESAYRLRVRAVGYLMGPAGP